MQTRRPQRNKQETTDLLRPGRVFLVSHLDFVLVSTGGIAFVVVGELQVFEFLSPLDETPPVSVRIRIEHYWTSVCCSLLCFDTLDAGQASMSRGPSVADGEESDTTVRKQKDFSFHDDLRNVWSQLAPRQDKFVT